GARSSPSGYSAGSSPRSASSLRRPSSSPSSESTIGSRAMTPLWVNRPRERVARPGRFGQSEIREHLAQLVVGVAIASRRGRALAPALLIQFEVIVDDVRSPAFVRRVRRQDLALILHVDDDVGEAPDLGEGVLEDLVL